MNQRRAEFYKTLGEWWEVAATQGYDWSQADTPESLQAEDTLWESKELYENGEINLSEIRPVFDAWLKTMKPQQETVTV